MLGTDGNFYDLAPYCFAWPYNDKGAGYPITPSYVPFTIPFPGPPYTRITNYVSTWPTQIKNYYQQQGWSQPSCPSGDTIQAHHIKPLAFGGDNSNGNGALLCSSDHYWYTVWWGSPSNGPFTPS